MIDATVFKMIEMRGGYGVQKVLKKVLEKGRCMSVSYLWKLEKV